MQLTQIILRNSFNSRPHKEVDWAAMYRGHAPWCLSIHDLTRRSTIRRLERSMAGAFQFTTSQGGRHMADTTASCLGPFNSRPHKEVDLDHVIRRHVQFLSIHDLTRRSTSAATKASVGLSFQFTTSQGGRPRMTGRRHGKMHLSIHDLTRRSTCRLHLFRLYILLSIHDLTRRSTIRPVPFGYSWDLSIHDLTRRSTDKFQLF